MSPRDEAIERLTKAAKGVADDWGWKGGKPGELTGGNFIRTIDEYGEFSGQDTYDAMQAAYRKAAKQLKDSGLAFDPDEEEVEFYMTQFKKLEDVGFPRELTGKVLRAIHERGDYIGMTPASGAWALEGVFKGLPKNRWNEPLQAIKSGLDYEDVVDIYDGYALDGLDMMPDQVSQVIKLMTTDRTKKSPRELALMVMKLDPKTRKRALEISAQDRADRQDYLLSDGDPL